MSLDGSRRKLEETRAHRHEAREARLGAKRRQLQEALEQAWYMGQLGFPAAAHRVQPRCPSRTRCLGIGCLALLAGAPGVLGTDGAVTGDAVSSAVIGGITNEIDTTLIGPGPNPVPGPRPSAEALTDLLMAQLTTDEIDQHSAMVQRALQAQRTLLQDALGSADRLAYPPPPGTPGTQLIQGAFELALTGTSRDIMNDILPPEFGPIPGRRVPNLAVPAAETGGMAACAELAAARNSLDAAKRDVVAAIREAKSVGSDIVIAALSLLSYGALGATGYGLEIGSSVTGIFTASPVNPAAAATGSILASANLVFSLAYASDAVAGAVAIHKLKEAYIDVLLRVSDAEAAWVKAHNAYAETVGKSLYGCPSPNGAQEVAGTPASRPAATSTPARGPFVTGAGTWGPEGAGPSRRP